MHVGDFETKWFEQRVDHFSFSNSDTFQQRYLVNDKFWNVDGGPIFYFVGCEGPIDTSAGHSVLKRVGDVHKGCHFGLTILPEQQPPPRPTNNFLVTFWQ